MKQKNKTVVLIMGICVILLFASGTLAYFTDQTVATTQDIATSSMDVELLAYTVVDGEKVPFPENGLDHIMPEQSVSKLVSVRNNGNTDAWVRVKATPVITSVNGESLSTAIIVGGNAQDVMIIEALEGWEYKDGYYYYKEILAPDQETSLLMETVKFNPFTPNDYMNASADLNLRAEAVQSGYNGDTVFDASGWPAEE